MRHPELSSAPLTFLVERYWPGIDEAGLKAVLPTLDRAALAMSAEGQPIRHIGSILMPTDQVVFSLISAASEAAVRELNQRAEMPVDRIAAAIQLTPEPTVEVE